MNNLQLILEELAGKDLVTIYHASKNPDLNGIMANDDFVPGSFGSGYMHGKGFYSVWKKEDLNSYGDFTYKGVVNLVESNILIIDPTFAYNTKQTISGNYIKKQLKKAGISAIGTISFPFLKDRDTLLFNKKEISVNEFNSSKLLRDILDENPSVKERFDGVAYKGDVDGHCLLMWNYHKVKIIGSFDVKKNKTEINAKSFEKQKIKKFRNETIYSSGNIKIVERNGDYLFFKNANKKNRKPEITMSRELKDSESFPLLDYKLFKNFLRENKIPKKIASSLTFTNGKKMIRTSNFSKTATERTGEFVSSVFSSSVYKDIKNGNFINRVNKILSLDKINGDNEEYLNQIDELTKGEEEKKIVLDYMKKTPIITHCLHLLPTFMEENKYIIFDCQNKKNISLAEEKNRLIVMPLKSFNGKFINFPRAIQLKLGDVFFLLKKDNIEEFDLTSFFQDTKIFITEIFGKYFSKKLKTLKNSVNMIFVDATPSYFSNAEVIPPCLFLKYPNYIDSVVFPNKVKIDFGNSKRNWVFTKNIKEVIITSGMDNFSLNELKKRNPNVNFTKEQYK